MQRSHSRSTYRDHIPRRLLRGATPTQKRSYKRFQTKKNRLYDKQQAHQGRADA